MLKTDLHLHTNEVIRHFDSVIKPQVLINEAAKQNFNVLCLTEHAAYNTIFGLKYTKNPLSTYYKYKDYAKSRGIKLIPGVETIVDGKEVLLINFTGEPKKYTKIVDLEKLKNENVLIIAPHPFVPRSSCLKEKLIEHIKIFDAIEHTNIYIKQINPNKKAEEVAKKYKKPLIATSDAHFLTGFGRNYSFVEANDDVDSVLEAIRKNKIKMVSEPWTTWQMAAVLGFGVYCEVSKELLHFFY
ncbi:MAG: PHP domain-containing protein [archaeon]